MTTTPTDKELSQLVQELKELKETVSNTNRPVRSREADFFSQNMERIAVQLKMYQSNPYGDLSDNYLSSIQIALDLTEEIKQAVRRNLTL
jgi:hypothetical protein